MGAKYKLVHLFLGAVVCIGCVSSSIFAQNAHLPAGLDSSSSLAQLLDWLNNNGFSQARIGLSSDIPAYEFSDPTDATTYSESVVFSQGFKLVDSDGCKVKLRNENLGLLEFWTKYPNPAAGSLAEFRKNQSEQYAGEFLIRLQDWKIKKGPFLHTSKAEKAATLGGWRTELKIAPKGRVSLIPSKSTIKLALTHHLLKVERTTDSQRRFEPMNGSTVSFTLDGKKASEDFSVVLKRAIVICRAE